MTQQSSQTEHPAQLCRVRVRFKGHRSLDYRAERTAANRFAEAVRSTGTKVTIDDRVCSALPPLPCERLWL